MLETINRLLLYKQLIQIVPLQPEYAIHPKDEVNNSENKYTYKLENYFGAYDLPHRNCLQSQQIILFRLPNL